MQSPDQKFEIPQLVIVGCGGVASYLLPCLLRTYYVRHLILFDGDTLEERNLDRQLFTPDKIGCNKAQALADLLQPQFPDTRFDVQTEYFHEGSWLPSFCYVIACVDNHTARRNILQIADREQCNVILAANEFTDSQAIYYDSSWKDTPLDPRVRYREILTDESDDPRRPASCQGALQQAHPQLAMANFGAASHALWLLWYWCVEATGLDEEVVNKYGPVEHCNNFSRVRTITTGDLDKEVAVR